MWESPKWTIVNTVSFPAPSESSSAGVKGELAIPCQAWEQGSIDTIPLPSRIYSIGKEVDSIQSPSSLQSFFDELDSLGAGKE